MTNPKRAGRLLAALCASLLAGSCAADSGTVDTSTSNSSECTEFPRPSELSKMNEVRSGLAEDIVGSLAPGWERRSEFRFRNHFFAIFVGFAARNGSSAPDVERDARKSLRSAGWVLCPDSLPQVIGVRFIDGYPVVARVVDASKTTPGESIDVPDLLQLEFSPVDYRLESDDDGP